MPPPEQLEASVHLAHCRDDNLAHLNRLDSLLVHGSQQSQRRDAAAATAVDAISCPTVSSASSQSGDCGIEPNGDVLEHMDSSYMVCTLGRNRKPSRKLQEAVHDYQVRAVAHVAGPQGACRCDTYFPRHVIDPLPFFPRYFIVAKAMRECQAVGESVVMWCLLLDYAPHH